MARRFAAHPDISTARAFRPFYASLGSSKGLLPKRSRPFDPVFLTMQAADTEEHSQFVPRPQPFFAVVVTVWRNRLTA
jgi:hypothetical protein